MKLGWQPRKIGDVLKLEYGKPLPKEQRNPNGAYPVYGANGIKDRTNAFYHNRPSIMVGRKGSAGEINLTENKFWPLDVTYFVTFDESQHDLLFIYYLLKKQELQKLAKGVKPGINRNDVYAINVEIPLLPEQKRIAAILDKAFAGIATATANAEKNLQNARELFESYLSAIFTKKGNGWVTTKLGELCSFKHGFAFKSEFFAPAGDYVLLTPGNFYESGGYRDRGEKQKYYVGVIPMDFVLEKGDFLVAMTEQAAGLLGSSIIVPESNRFLHNQRLGLAQVHKRTKWVNEFFFHHFNTRNFRKAVHSSASGIKVRHTSPKKLGEIDVCYPHSRDLQIAIAKKLDDLRTQTISLQAIYQQKLTNLAELKQSILQKAFSGELTRKAA